MFYDLKRLSVAPDARLVILGDPHGDLDGSRRALEREHQPRTVELCVGDVVGHADGPTSSALAEYLEQRGVVTIQGNHEEWYLRGRELVFVDKRGADRKLTGPAHNWVATLPERLDVLCGSTTPVVTLVHGIKRPMWEDVEPGSVGRLVRAVPDVRVVVVGHSHCPRIFHHIEGERARVTDFAFDEVEEVAHPFPEYGTLVIDAGSISHPQRATKGARRTHDFGTYAVIDLAAREARLRRVDKRRPA